MLMILKFWMMNSRVTVLQYRMAFCSSSPLQLPLGNLHFSSLGKFRYGIPSLILMKNRMNTSISGLHTQVHSLLTTGKWETWWILLFPRKGVTASACWWIAQRERTLWLGMQGRLWGRENMAHRNTGKLCSSYHMQPPASVLSPPPSFFFQGKL